MNRRTLFFLGLSGLAGCARSRRPRLNVMNWSEYVAPETVPDFEREFGVEVRYSLFESNEEMLARVFSGNSGWDVVFPSNYFIRPMIENNLLARLDRSLLPNLGNLDAMFSAPAWDPAHEVSVPYMWGATGILYQGSLDPEPHSWASLWDVRLSGRFTMLDDPADTIGAALIRLGHSLNAEEAGSLAGARAALIEQKPLVRAYLNAEARGQVAAGDLLAAHLWTTTSQLAIADRPTLKFVLPREGFPLYCDNAVILRESRRAETAHQFLNYLLRPEAAEAAARHSRTATANEAARALLPPEMRESPVLYPPPDVLARGEWFETPPAPAQRLRDRIWTEVKAA
jgi:spermidine/putrescine transport system substrate-binding protein